MIKSTLYSFSKSLQIMLRVSVIKKYNQILVFDALDAVNLIVLYTLVLKSLFSDSQVIQYHEYTALIHTLMQKTSEWLKYQLVG